MTVNFTFIGAPVGYGNPETNCKLYEIWEYKICSLVDPGSDCQAMYSLSAGFK